MRVPTPPGLSTPETAKTKLDKLLGAKNSELRTVGNEIESIGTTPSYGRLEVLQETRTSLERERNVLDWTRQLYNIAHEPKKGQKSDKQTQNDLWNAIANLKVRFYKDIDAEVWKLVDPMLEQLWGDLGNTEPYHGSNETYATGFEASPQ